MPDPGGCYAMSISVASSHECCCRSKVVRQWLVAWWYGTSSTSSFSSNGIRLAKSRQLDK
jgi:hypothetical protein